MSESEKGERGEGAEGGLKGFEYLEVKESAGVAASLLEYLHACPICHCTDMRHYVRVPSLFNPGETIRYERCADCKTVVRNPRLPPEYRLARYEEPEMSDESKRLKPKSQVHYAYMMKAIERLAPTGLGRRLFDFGCGAGGFLLEARKAGWDVSGLELSKDLAKHVIEHHEIPVFQGLIDAPEFAEERFDVVISSQVFEHLLDPRQTWADPEAYDKQAAELVAMFVKNFAQYEAQKSGASQVGTVGMGGAGESSTPASSHLNRKSGKSSRQIADR